MCDGAADETVVLVLRAIESIVLAIYRRYRDLGGSREQMTSNIQISQTG